MQGFIQRVGGALEFSPPRKLENLYSVFVHMWAFKLTLQHRIMHTTLNTIIAEFTIYHKPPTEKSCMKPCDDIDTYWFLLCLQLEVEVDTLKSRLDGLRKAKNTTIIRREREEIRVSSPKLGRHRSSATSTPTPHPPPTPTPNGCRDNRTFLIGELKAQVHTFSWLSLMCLWLLVYVNKLWVFVQLSKRCMVTFECAVLITLGNSFLRS